MTHADKSRLIRVISALGVAALVLGLPAGCSPHTPVETPAVPSTTPIQESPDPSIVTVAPLPDLPTPLQPAPTPQATPELTVTPFPTFMSPLDPADYGLKLDTEYGIQIHGCGPWDLNEALDLVKAGGYTWVKQQVRWEEVEGERGVSSWRCIDAVVNGANARDLRVLLSVTTAPEWARPYRDSRHPKSAEVFADFCRRLVARYPGSLHALEVFNEPNLSLEWGPKIDPAEYARMLELTYYAVKQIAPGVMVISAAPAPTEWSVEDVAMPDDDFLAALVENGGIRWVDCVGAHFNHGTMSPLTPDGQFEELILGYRDILEDKRPICITELGYAVAIPGTKPPQGFEWAADNTLEEQAQWLAEVWDWAEGRPRLLRLVIVWNLNYWSSGRNDPNPLYSLWKPWDLMPAYYALQEKNAWLASPDRGLGSATETVTATTTAAPPD